MNDIIEKKDDVIKDHLNIIYKLSENKQKDLTDIRMSLFSKHEDLIA